MWNIFFSPVSTFFSKLQLENERVVITSVEKFKWNLKGIKLQVVTEISRLKMKENFESF